MTHFFISYSKRDTRELALALNAALNALPDVTAWVDKSLLAGKSWELQVQREIDRCDFMLVLYSPDINRHQHGEEESYVLTEIAYAKYTVKKPIIPIMAQKTAPPIALTTAQYIDFTLPGLRLDDLVAAICQEAGINLSVSPTFTVLPRPPVPPKPIPSRVYDLLPAPFEWIEIPAGKVTLITQKGWSANYIPEGHSHTFEVPTFAIAKYPVTNAQYALFIEAGGYQEKHWWTAAGWEVCEQGYAWDAASSSYKPTGKAWTQPRYWGDTKWNGAEQPVVGVSWHEAVAFCQWLSESSDEGIMLPSEQQWQRAAQGDDGRAYPWGNRWDCARCNNSVKPCDSDQTTSVQQYEGRYKGDSPFGVVDMAGNVWEWCLTEYETGKVTLENNNMRVLRGGSWRINLELDLRVDFRDGFAPYKGNLSRGFRLSRSF